MAAPGFDIPRKAGADRGRHGNTSEHHDGSNDKNYARIAQGLQGVIRLEVLGAGLLETQIDKERLPCLGENIPRRGNDAPPHAGREEQDYIHKTVYEPQRYSQAVPVASEPHVFATRQSNYGS